jgi:hypothetical protein
MRGLMLGLLVLCAACTPTQNAPEAPGAVVAQREMIVSQAGLAAPGDTLRYTVSWTAGARATGYLVTTTVTQGTGWSGLLTNAPTAGLTMAFTPVNPAAWDSVSFSACVASTANGKTSAPKCTSWAVKRGPGAPGTVTVDSSLVIAQLLLKPDSAAIGTLASQQFCPFFKALDGKVRITSGYETLPACQGYYDALPAAEQLPGYPVALSWTPLRVPVTPGWSVAVRTPSLELAHLMFAGPFA